MGFAALVGDLQHIDSLEGTSKAQVADSAQHIFHANQLNVSLSASCTISQHKAAGILLNLEFNGVLRSLPGKVYQLN